MTDNDIRPAGEAASPHAVGAQFTQHVCFTIACARCRTVLDDGDSMTIHFDTIEQAEKDAIAYDWEKADDGLICPECAAKAACEREGHTWPEWTPALTGEREFRFCTRCSVRDIRPAAAPSPGGAS